MAKIRRTILGVVSGIYLVLFITKIDIPGRVSTPLLFILLANLAVEEWMRYKEIKRKIHLLIPIATLLLVVYLVSNLIYVTLM